MMRPLSTFLCLLVALFSLSSALQGRLEPESDHIWPLPDDPNYRDMRFAEADPAAAAPTPAPVPAAPAPAPAPVSPAPVSPPVPTSPATPAAPTTVTPASDASPKVLSAPVPTPQPTGPKKMIVVLPLDTAAAIPPEPVIEKVREGEEFLDPQDKDPVLQNNDPEVKAVNTELDGVRLDIIATNRRLQSESKWVESVEKILEEYDGKMKAVHAHVNELRGQMKEAYHKKMQLKNLRIQHDLNLRLDEAGKAKDTLLASMAKVKEKDEKLIKNRAMIEATIKGIKESLVKLTNDQQKIEEEGKEDDEKEEKKEKEKDEKELKSL